jgi:hypothetical protein
MTVQQCLESYFIPSRQEGFRQLGVGRTFFPLREGPLGEDVGERVSCRSLPRFK